jgi:hypothetical protein
MATVTAFLQPDYANTVSVTNSTAILTAGSPGVGTTASPLTFGKRRILHISAINTGTQSNRAAVSYTLGLSTGITAPTPTATSPFFMGDEGFTIDLGDLYDQLQLGNDSTKNGNASTVAYSISVMSKF